MLPTVRPGRPTYDDLSMATPFFLTKNPLKLVQDLRPGFSPNEVDENSVMVLKETGGQTPVAHRCVRYVFTLCVVKKHKKEAPPLEIAGGKLPLRTSVQRVS